MIDAEDMAGELILMMALGWLSTPLVRLREREMIVPEGCGFVIALPLGVAMWAVIWGMM